MREASLVSRILPEKEYRFIPETFRASILPFPYLLYSGLKSVPIITESVSNFFSKREGSTTNFSFTKLDL